MIRKAIVVGCSGQDGRLLWDRLIELGYELTGVSRAGLAGQIPDGLHFTSISDPAAVAALVSSVQPDEIYYLAAHHNSSEERDTDLPVLFRDSFDVNTQALINFLDAVRSRSPNSRLFFAASSHVFGMPTSPIQDENTPFNPNSPYGISKAAGIFACRHYRQYEGVFASCGILYNHESELRPEKFLSRKIALGVARIKSGVQEKLKLGDLGATADWGYAPDFAEAMRLILATERPDDFIVATGKSHTVRDFVDTAFAAAGLDYQQYVEADPATARPRSHRLIGNASRLASITGWRPSTEFADMVRKLVADELARRASGLRG